MLSNNYVGDGWETAVGSTLEVQNEATKTTNVTNVTYLI
jgi:hypothetical protein